MTKIEKTQKIKQQLRKSKKKSQKKKELLSEKITKYWYKLYRITQIEQKTSIKKKDNITKSITQNGKKQVLRRFQILLLLCRLFILVIQYS